jgi:hypothetical protein
MEILRKRESKRVRVIEREGRDRGRGREREIGRETER